MNMSDLDYKRIESFKILLYEIMKRKQSENKIALYIDLEPRLPEDLTNQEIESAIKELEKEEYISFEGSGFRSRFNPGARFSMWQISPEQQLKNMTDDKLELAILKKYVDHHKSCEINNPNNSNKCSRELDMREVIKEITGEKDKELEYTAKQWLYRLAPDTPGTPNGLLRPCCTNNLKNSSHKYHARAYIESSRKPPTPAWDRIRELELIINSNKPIVQKIQIIGEQIMGDKFENIRNATIISRSTVIDAFKVIKEQHDEDTADALATVAKEVENSGNQAAGTLFDSFNNELCAPNPDKSKLKQYWDGLVSVLPSVAQLTDAAVKIGGLFTGTA